MNTRSDSAEPTPTLVFDWQDAIATAPGLRDRDRIRAMVLARHGDKLTGTGVWVDRVKRAAAFGVSVKTIDRLVERLLELGYMHQTQKAAPGRGARYILTLPDVGHSQARPVERADVGQNSAPPVERAPSDVRQNKRVTLDTETPPDVHVPQENQLPPPPAPSHEGRRASYSRVEQALVDLGAVAAEVAELVEAANVDESTKHSVLGRLHSDPGYIDDLRRQVAHRRRSESLATRKCPHGRVDGHQIRGAGHNASRICDRCETADPAPVEAAS